MLIRQFVAQLSPVRFFFSDGLPLLRPLCQLCICFFFVFLGPLL